MESHAESVTNLEEILLSSGLNEDCFVKILEYLRFCDLLIVCDLDNEMDKSITNLIKDRIIRSTTLFDFDEIQSEQRSWSVNKIFEHFGHLMKRSKILIPVKAFNPFLRKIIRNCQPNHLTELEIASVDRIDIYNDDNYGRFIDIDPNLLIEVRPYFRSLEKLTIKQNFKFDCWMEKWLNQFHLPNLKSLTLQNVYCQKTWLELFPFREISLNITELRLLNIKLEEEMIDFRKFLDLLPNLEVFVHTGGQLGFKAVADELLQRFPNLRGFGYSIRLRDDVPIDFNERFQLLRKFKNLSEFHLQSDSLYGYVHSILQYTPNIKTLAIWQTNSMDRAPVEFFYTVESIKYTIANRSDRFPINDHIHLHVNQNQFNEFKAIKNIDKFIRLTVENTKKFN